MPSTYTTNGGIELIATGEQSGTWGTTTNTNLQIVDRLTNGVGSIALSGTTHTLTTTDGTLSDGQYAVLVFGGSPSGTNTVTISPNDAQHVYFVKNSSGQSVVLTQGSGGNVTVADGKSAIVYADGAGAGAEVVDITDTFDFQPLTATLTAIGALAVTDGNIIVGDGSTWVAESGATARTTLGLGSIATQAANNVSITGGSISGITDLAVSDGGTGASSFTANNVLLGNGTSAFQVVAPGTSGNVLTSNGTTWTSSPPAAGYTDSDVDAHLNVSTATTGEILSWTGSDYDWIAAPAALTGQTDSASPFETSLGVGAGAVNTGANNTFIGYEAGNDNTTGTDNVAVGYQALDANISGNNNIAIGSSALGANTYGLQNVAIGHQSLGDNSTGVFNVAVGHSALSDNTTGRDNVGVGYQALLFTTTGQSNVAVGFNTLRVNTTGSNNVAIGNGALDAATTGGTNVAIGLNAMGSGTATASTGRNVAIGESALADATTGYSNIAFGRLALANLTTGYENVAIGETSLFLSTSGYRNIAIGKEAIGSADTSGGNNIGIGYRSAKNLTTGLSNALVGFQTGLSLTTGSNNVAIGNGALDAATTGGRNIAIGQDAMGSGVATASTGDNIAIGYQAGFDLTSATNAVLIGDRAGENLTTGNHNIGIGYRSMAGSTAGFTGASNVGVGFECGQGLTTGGSNSIFGHAAGTYLTTGSNNVIAGAVAGYSVSTGAQNVIIGRNAAFSGTNNLTTGSNNIVIGDSAAASSATVSNEITLGNSSITNLRVPGVGFQFDTTDGLIVPKTVTAGGTTGAQTINKTAGTVNFAAAATSLVVTNSFVDTNSIIIATVGTDDTTMKSVAVVAGAGSFTLYANAAATAETRVNWFVAN